MVVVLALLSCLAGAPAADRGWLDEPLRAEQAGDPRGAWAALVDGLAAALEGPAWTGDDLDAAELELAARMLAAAAAELDLWPETAAALGRLAPFPADLPAAVAHQLDRTRAAALRHVGRVDEARALSDAGGLTSAFVVAGPFDNERGSGFAVAYEPERGIDMDASMRGKERTVGWRENPAPEHPLRRLRLDAMLRPPDQAVAYAATALRCEVPRDAVLSLGTGGPVKVFLNGVELLSRDVRRPLAPDQDRVVLPLAAGANHLLIKVAIEEGPWSLDARLTDLAGAPLDDVAIDPDALREAPPEPRAADPDARPYADARTILERLAAEPGPARARAARRLALLHLTVHPEDVDGGAAEEAAALAVELAPDHVGARYLLARALAPAGALMRTERRVNPHLAAFEGVLERDPAHVMARLDLARFWLTDNPIPDAARAEIDRALEIDPDGFRALSQRARLLDGTGRGSEAQLVARRMAAGDEGRTRASAALVRAQEALAAGRTRAARDELLAATERSLRDGPVLSLALEVLADLGRVDAALGLARRCLDAWPFATDRMLATARLAEAFGRLADARALVERAVEVCPECTEPRWVLARLDVRDGRVDDAVAGLETLLELEPSHAAARRYAELLTEREEERFETPWRRDLVATLDAVPAADAAAGEPLEMVDRTTVWRLWEDGTEHRYEHVVLRPLAPPGVRALDRYRVAYPASAQLEVLNARVVRPDGRTERASRARRRDPLAAGGTVRVREYELPPLAPGDLVDVEYRVEDRGRDVFGAYFGHRHEFYPESVDGLAPTRRSELVVIAPEAMDLHVVERRADGLEAEVEVDDGRGLVVRRWVARDLARPPLESAMPRREELAPVVELSTYASWDEFADWWWSFIEKEFTVTPAMREKVRELTAGLGTEREKVAAIARFVAQDVRYNLWPFGTHGYEPYSAATIFERRFGDCKDKTILLRVLLGEVGVEAVPVLLRAEWARPEEDISAARVGHFNHCIAWLPPTDERGGYYLDATAALNPIDYLRADDQGARVVRIDETGAELARIPYAPPEENALRRDYEIELAPDGAGTVTLRDASTGHFAVRLRQRFGGETEGAEAVLAAELRATFGGVDVASVRVSDLDDVTVPAELEARFGARDLWSTQGDLRGLPVAIDPVGLDRVAVEAPEARVHDVVLDRPYALESTVTWLLPDGVEVASVPPLTTVQVPGLLRYEQRAERAPGRVVVTRRFALETRRVSPEDYRAFRDALGQVRQAESRQVLLALPPGVDP